MSEQQQKSTTDAEIASLLRRIKATYGKQYKLENEQWTLREKQRKLEKARARREEEQQPPLAADAAADAGPWACDGNIISGDVCPEPNNTTVEHRAANTRWEKKTYRTCKACKKAIARAKRARREEVVSVDEQE